MKLLLLSAALLLSGFCLSQAPTSRYTLKEIGLTIDLSRDSQPVGEAESAKRSERGKEFIGEANGILADMSQTKTLFTAAKQFNYASVTITPFDPATDGNYREVNQIVLNILTKTFEQKCRMHVWTRRVPV